MQRLALLCFLVPAGAVLSGTPVTNPTIRNAVASLATLTPGGKWKTSCTGAFVDLDGLGNVWRNGTWWFATAAHCLADEDKKLWEDKAAAAQEAFLKECLMALATKGCGELFAAQKAAIGD